MTRGTPPPRGMKVWSRGFSDRPAVVSLIVIRRRSGHWEARDHGALRRLPGTTGALALTDGGRARLPAPRDAGDPEGTRETRSSRGPRTAAAAGRHHTGRPDSSAPMSTRGVGQESRCARRGRYSAAGLGEELVAATSTVGDDFVWARRRNRCRGPRSTASAPECLDLRARPAPYLPLRKVRS